MKYIYLLLLAFVPLFTFSQEKGTIEYLDSNPRYGEIMLGDSITRNLTKLSLLEEKR